MSLRGILEGKARRDRRRGQPRAEHVENAGEDGRGVTPAAVDCDVTAEQVDEVDRHIFAAMRTDNRDPTAVPGRADSAPQGFAARDIEDDVDADALGEAQHGRGEVFLGVVDAVGGAQTHHVIGLFGRPGGPDDRRPQVDREPRRGGSDCECGGCGGCVRR